jgi:hypothetical protein
MQKVAPRRKSAREFLESQEDHWRSRLAGVALVYELEPEPEDCRRLLRAFRALYEARLRQKANPSLDFLRYKSALVVAMGGFAIDGYRDGCLWPQFWEAVDYDGTDEDQAFWGRMFMQALAKLGKPTFDVEAEGSEQRFVTPILIHTGVPTAALPELLTLIVDRRSSADLAPEELARWVAGDVAVPVQAFLRHGGGSAVDLVGRVDDLLDRLGDGRDTADLLPSRYVECARGVVAP